jgi:TRAP-type C4-dicarboxylate transport system substrate-binding protein
MRATISRLMITAGVAGLASSLAPVSSHGAEKILFNCFFPPQHYVCRKMLPELGNRIDKATAGRVTITIPPKSVAAPPDQYDAVVNGVVDGALQFNTFIANKVAGIQVGQLPFVGIEAAEPASVALWRTYQKFFADKGEYKGVVLLSVYVANGAEFFSTTDTPIQTVEDVKNRKMWALPGSTANLIKETGAPVVAGPAVQMLETISKGVVDGYVGIGASAAQVFKLTPYTKSVTIFKNKIFQPTFSFFVSDKKWGQISAADQDAIKKALGEDYARYAGALQDAEDKANQVKFYGAGVKRLDGSDAELAKLTALGQPTIDAWIKRVGAMNVDGKAALAYYQATISEELAKMKK